MPRSAIRSILAATDLSSSSDKVVRSAAVLAERLGAELHLLHVPDLTTPLPATTAAGEPSLPERTQRAEQQVQEQVQWVAQGAIPASVRVISGPVHEAILAQRKAVSADLIVVGPHRGGDVGAHVLGTTADRVIRGAEVPCLVVSAPLGLPARRIGVPIDFSDPARGALHLALALSGSLSGDHHEPGEVRVFHVGWRVEQADDPALEQQKIRPVLEREVAMAIERLDATRAPEVRTEVLWGVSPTESIVQYADQAELDLLVLGTRGEGGLKRLLVGSVASGVAHNATSCPVLLIPPRIAGHESGGG